jgi:hypothetical protein
MGCIVLPGLVVTSLYKREADARLINVMCISSKVPVSGTRSASILNIGHLRLRRGATILNNVTSAFALDES